MAFRFVHVYGTRECLLFPEWLRFSSLTSSPVLDVCIDDPLEKLNVPMDAFEMERVPMLLVVGFNVVALDG